MSAPNAWGLTYNQVISLCWLAYAGQGTEGQWKFSDGTLWTLNEVNEVGSFRAVLVTSPSGKKILSFSGTDGLLTFDWVANAMQEVIGLAPQYTYASALGVYYSPDVVVGHSLGGGLATYTGVYRGIQTATFNPAPLVNPPSSSKVINYVVKGEGLDILDKYDGTRTTRVGPIHYVQSTGLNPVDKHLIKNLVGFVAPTRVSFYSKFSFGR